MDLFEKLANNMGPLGMWADIAEGYWIFPKLEGELKSRMQFNGKEIICWSINNYLGLGNHPEVRAVDNQATKDWGLAYPMGSRMMSGNTDLHDEFEGQLASFVQKDAAILLNFGYQGIMSSIDAMVDRHDVIVYDSESHACIIDGVRMHLGKRFAFEHNDMESLEKCLKRAKRLTDENGKGGILVISEGVFGMRGDQGKLKEIVAYKKEYGFRLLVDDAHGFGTLGATGAGAGEEQGVQDEIDVYFATFAKAMGSVGAFIAGNKEIVRYLKYNMRSQIYAKSLMMPLVVGGMKRLEMLRDDPSHKAKLWENVNALQSGLKARGLDIGDTNSCVTPVYMHGSMDEAMALVKDMRENYNVFTSLVIYPVIPKGMVILRLIPTASHTMEDIEITLDAFEAIAKKLKNGEYKVAEGSYTSLLA